MISYMDLREDYRVASEDYPLKALFNDSVLLLE